MGSQTQVNLDISIEIMEGFRSGDLAGHGVGQCGQTVVGMPRRNYRRVYGELHLMLNQLGKCSISCLRPAIKTERLVRSNERQDQRSVLLFVNLQSQAPCTWTCWNSSCTHR